MTKKIIARENSIAAGRDVVLNLNIAPESLDPSTVVSALASVLKVDEAKAIELLKAGKEQELTPGRLLDALSGFSIVLNLQSEGTRQKYAALSTAADTAAVKAAELRLSLRQIANALRDSDYRVAYMSLKELMRDDECPDRLKVELIGDCLQCGYIYFSNEGRTAELPELVELLGQSPGDADFTVSYLILEMQQEHATRQEEPDLLEENLQRIDALLRDTPSPSEREKSKLLLLKALCLRRLGERGIGNYKRLGDAEEILEKLIKSGSSERIEVINTLANVQLRLFSVFGDADALERAGVALTNLPELGEEAELSEVQAYPKCLNAYGNYFKQRTRSSGSFEDYRASMEKYSLAERFFTEGRAPYEWAMLQKNKADVRVSYLTASGMVDQDILTDAYEEINKSLRYRTPEAAGYQYKRSIAVRDRIEEIAGAARISLS